MSSLFSIFKARPLHLLPEVTIGLWQTMESIAIILGLIVVILGLIVLGLEALGLQVLGLEILGLQVLGDAKLGAGFIYRDLYSYRYSEVDRYSALGCAFLDAYVSKRIMNNCCDVNKPGFGSIESNSIGQAWGQNEGQNEGQPWLIFDRTQHSPRTTKSNQDGLMPA